MLRLLTWPFRLAFDLIGFVLDLTGSLLGLFLGIGLCCTGVLLCMSVIGLIAGLPLVILGGGLILKSIF